MRLAKSLLHRHLHNFHPEDAVEVAYADGEIRRYGPPPDDIPVPLLRFADPGAEMAVLLDPELRFGEMFCEGRITVERGEIVDVLMRVGSARARGATSWAACATNQFRGLTRRLRQRNIRTTARANVRHHYDLDSGLYELFLDADRQYSCAYFESPSATLDEAQRAKKRHIAAKLELEPGMRVLDIGSGWGGLGLYLAETCDVEVVGVTLSDAQHRISSKRAAERGLAGQVQFNLMDYRNVEGVFDRIVSVGMFEHVGVAFYRRFFDKCQSLLRENGSMLLHTIGRLEPPDGTNPWIQRYIFPGGYIPSLSEVAAASERTGLICTDVEVLRDHYAQTLRHWRARFLARREEAVQLFGAPFCRRWEFYLAACEMAFVHRNLAVFQYQLARRLDSLPILRGYMAERESRLRQREKHREAVGRPQQDSNLQPAD